MHTLLIMSAIEIMYSPSVRPVRPVRPSRPSFLKHLGFPCYVWDSGECLLSELCIVNPHKMHTILIMPLSKLYLLNRSNTY